MPSQPLGRQTMIGLVGALPAMQVLRRGNPEKDNLDFFERDS